MIETDSALPRSSKNIATSSSKMEGTENLLAEQSTEFVKVQKCDWNPVIAKVQKSDEQQVANVQLLTSMQEVDKQINVQTLTECRLASLQPEKSSTDALHAHQDILISTKPKNGLWQQTLDESSAAAALGQIVDEKEPLTEFDSASKLKHGSGLETCDNENRSSSDCNATDALIPRLDVLLREGGRPEAWYSSWRLAPKESSLIGVSKSTFESLAQEHAHLQQQMAALSEQRGFDLKTNLELQESVCQLQVQLEQKDALIQQLKAKICKATEIISQRNKLVEAYSLQCGRLQNEIKKTVAADTVQEAASVPSQREMESVTVAKQQDTIRDLEAKVEAGRMAAEKLQLLERQNVEWERKFNQQRQMLEQNQQEKAMLAKNNADQRSENDKLKADAAERNEEKAVLLLQVKQFQDDYEYLRRDGEHSDKKHTSLVENYRAQIKQLTGELDFYKNLNASASARVEAEVAMPRSLTPRVQEVRKLGNSPLQESYTLPSISNQSHVSTPAMKTYASAPSFGKQQTARDTDSGYGTSSLGFSAANSYAPPSAMHGFTCSYCHQSFTDEQKYMWHCVKCIPD